MALDEAGNVGVAALKIGVLVVLVLLRVRVACRQPRSWIGWRRRKQLVKLGWWEVSCLAPRPTKAMASTPSVATAVVVVVRAVSVHMCLFTRAVSVHMCLFTRAVSVRRGSTPAVRGGVRWTRLDRWARLNGSTWAQHTTFMPLKQFKGTRARGEGEGGRITRRERGRGVGRSSGRSAVSGA